MVHVSSIDNICLQVCVCVHVQYVCECTSPVKSCDYTVSVLGAPRGSDQVYLSPGALVVPRPPGQVVHLSLIPDESC